MALQNPFEHFQATTPDSETGLRSRQALFDLTQHQEQAIDGALAEMLKFQANDKVPEMEVPEIPSPINAFSLIGAAMQGQEAVQRLGQKAERHQRLMTQAQLTADAERLRQEGYLQRRKQQVAESISRLKVQKENLAAEFNAKVKLAEIAGDEKGVLAAKQERLKALEDSRERDAAFVGSDNERNIDLMMRQIVSGNKYNVSRESGMFLANRDGQPLDAEANAVKLDPVEIAQLEDQVRSNLMALLDEDSFVLKFRLDQLDGNIEARKEAFAQVAKERETALTIADFNRDLERRKDEERSAIGTSARERFGASELGGFGPAFGGLFSGSDDTQGLEDLSELNAFVETDFSGSIEENLDPFLESFRASRALDLSNINDQKTAVADSLIRSGLVQETKR